MTDSPFALLGSLIFPASVLLMLIKNKGPAKQLLAIGAVSPQTARKPLSAEITNPDLLDSPVRRGVIVDMQDGRFYVDQRVYRRNRMLLFGAVIFVMLVIIACFIWWMMNKT